MNHSRSSSPAVQAQAFDLRDVRLLAGEFKRAMDINAEWLLGLEADRFLAWFRKEAGLEPKAPVYRGWESTGVAGHALGHYLTALSHQYRATGDERFHERTAYIVGELALCQAKHGDGFVAAIPKGRDIFEEVRRGSIRFQSQGNFNDGWAPWYTMDKMLAGLRDVYVGTGNQQALDVLIGLADYFYEVTRNLNDAQWQEMMRCEFGGMSHSLAELYAITRDPRHLELADKFYHKAMLDPLTRGEDPLPGKHANTQVPKLRGLAAIYDLTGREDHRFAAEFFWNTVVKQHSYVNGGNSSHEHFGPPGQLNDRLEASTETCNTYNMLRLTRHLYGWDPKAEFMDYYERALVNQILASQHRESGMVVYLGAMDMPARKLFSTPTDSWWCCVGTGMENHTKYADSIYYHAGDRLYVNLFVASTLDFREKGMSLHQETDFPFEDHTRLRVETDQAVDLDLRIRRPAWCDQPTLRLNGEALEPTITDEGYLCIPRRFSNGDVIDLHLPMTLRTEAMPDNPRRLAFFYGPVLLAATLDDGLDLPLFNHNHHCALRPTLARLDRVPMLVSPADRLLESFVPMPEERLNFIASALGRRVEAEGVQTVDIRLRPVFAIGADVYSAYLDHFTPDQWEQEKKAIEAKRRIRQELDARTLGVMRLGEAQPEQDHNLTGEDSYNGNMDLAYYRAARKGGWFAFDLSADPDAPMELIATYSGRDKGPHRFDILVEEEKVATQNWDGAGDTSGKFYDAVYPIPEGLTQGKSSIRVTFKAHPGHTIGWVLGCKTMRQASQS